ncbi:MAG: M20/M25/M40 family metallo-hydrolase [Acidobacteriota bacterium]
MVLLLVLPPLLLIGSVVANAAPVAEPEILWITLGRDAFEALQRDGNFFVDHRPMRSEGEVGDVVMTRVRAVDMDRLALLTHEGFHRCPGFVVHGSEAEALASMAMAATATGPLRGQVSYQIAHEEAVNRIAPDVDADLILETITRLSTDFPNRYYTHPSGRSASLWIRDLWQGYAGSRSDVQVELYEHPNWLQPSVILTIQGTTRPQEVVVLGGHLDSIAQGSSDPDFSAPGADDNASGIAVLSEAIRVLMEDGFRAGRTVKFMGYAAEERGLLGAQEIAQDFVADPLNDVVAVMQFDLSAFNGSVEDMGLLSDFTNGPLTAFVGQLVDAYQPSLQRISTACGYGCSDHAAWHNRGFPAAMAVEARFGEHNQLIHTTSDTVATIGNSGDHAAKFARLAVAFAVEIGLDGSPGLVFASSFDGGTLEEWSAVQRPEEDG